MGLHGHRLWRVPGACKRRRAGATITVMRLIVSTAALCLAVSGCINLSILGRGSDPPPAPSIYTGTIGTPDEATIRPSARPGEGANTSSEPSGTINVGELGRSTVSLGDPTRGGLWIETDLVAAPRPGRVTVPSNGRFVMVTLRPGASGGARASLQALQSLGLSPAALTEIVIYGL
jgi:hypothetical protein